MSTWFPLHASATTASLTLTVFWAMVTAGRVLFAVVQRWVPSRLAYHVLPVVLAGSFVFIAELPPGSAGAGVLAFGLAGAGLLATASADHQLRPGEADDHFGRRSRRRDRVLSVRLRTGRLRGRPAPFRRGHAARDLWRNR